MLELRNLTKRYGANVAVDDLSLTIPRGSRFGLLGPNGAGKTTTISVLVGALKPDGGAALLDGAPVGSEDSPAKRKIGYVPQELALYEDLTARDNLRLFGALYGLGGRRLAERIDAVLALVGLGDRAGERVRAYSGGMKRRLNLAAALLHEPELLVLDEPTVGVDPQSRNAIFENLETLCAGGMTLLYTTHYMEEAERLCDRIAVMDHGKILAQGTRDELRALLPGGGNRLSVALVPGTALHGGALNDLRAGCGAAGVSLADDGTLTLELESLAGGVAAALGWLDRQGIAYTSVGTQRPSLEAVFLHLTGRSLRDA